MLHNILILVSDFFYQIHFISLHNHNTLFSQDTSDTIGVGRISMCGMHYQPAYLQFDAPKALRENMQKCEFSSDYTCSLKVRFIHFLVCIGGTIRNLISL